MERLSTTHLAQRLNLSKGRISQYVAAGKLEGCYEGSGRDRVFDLAKVAEALGRKLDIGQMTGNGLKTRRALRGIEGQAEPRPSPETQDAPRRDGPLPLTDPDRLELAKIATAEENLRRIRRDNEAAEGHFVLASEVERQVARTLAQEIAEVETVLRDGARAIADQLGVDFKAARKVLIDHWRAHRKARTVALEAEAAGAEMTEAETAADI